MSQQLEAKPQSDDNEEIKFFVNGEEEIVSFQKTPDRKILVLTVREILTRAGFTPTEDYELTQDADNHTYGSPDAEVPVEHGDRFTAKHKGPTPAS